MLVPLSWLREYVDISGVSVKELRDKMSSSGLAVERQHSVGEKIEKIVIGEILSKEKHPDSDHLWVCTVKIKDENGTVQIVTGAQNIFVGARVPVILPGMELPDGSKIEATKLRGLDSHGMMCSEKELGLGEGHEGIMILDQSATVGQKLVEYLGLPDIVFDVEVTANRGDCLSMVGVAREVATLLGKELKMPEMKQLIKSSNSSEKLSVEIEDQKKCLRFAAGVFDGFKLSTAPVWMQQRLTRAGMRPINNIVDITNYVMLELGQPTHAYNADQVTEGHFVVRSARPSEVLQTLDKKEHKLDESMLLICDPVKNLGVAGIMGGESSKITADTHKLILEAANFDPVNVRRTGIKLGIRSDAIVRFERGVDPELIPLAMQRINYLLSEYTGASLASDVVDVYPNKISTPNVSLNSKKLEKYIGDFMPLSQVEKILNGLGFKTVSSTDGDTEWVITVSVPTWRWRDVSIEEDLIEEVARMHGYDNLPTFRPQGQMPIVVSNKRLQVKKRVLQTMKGVGFQEVLTYSFNSREQIEMSGYKVEQALEMASPLSEEHRYMRLSLLPNLLWVLKKNEYMTKEHKLFELSSVYHRYLYPILPEEAVSLALEPVYLSGLIGGKGYDFGQAFKESMGNVELVLEQLGIKGYKFVQDKELISKIPASVVFHPGRVGALVLSDGLVLGLSGEIHPAVQEKLGLSDPAFIFEFQMQPIVENAKLVTQFRPYSIYPASTESISFIMGQNQAVGEVVEAIKELDERIVSISAGKPYTGDQIELGKKAVSFTLVYQSNTGSINEKDALTLREKVISSVKEIGLSPRV